MAIMVDLTNKRFGVRVKAWKKKGLIEPMGARVMSGATVESLGVKQENTLSREIDISKDSLASH
jgi:hypothetical protein